MHRVSLLIPFLALSLVARAHADDAGAPSPNPSPSPSPTPSALAPSVDDDLPLRFRDMLRLEASRARTGRYFNGVLSTLAGAGVVVAGVVSLTTAADGDNARKDISYIIIGTGGLGVLSSVLGLFGQTPIERLYEAYAPFAEDPKFTADQRLREGEDALRQMAESDTSSRRIGGITNIVVGAALGGLAIFFGVSTLFTPDDRIVLGTLTGVSAVVAIGSGIGQMWFQRGPAEVALEHWEAARGLKHEALSLRPSFSPTHGGAMGGLTLTF